MNKKEYYFLIIGLIAVGILGRLIPHPWNMTPVAAIALFASAYLGARASLAIFFGTMVVADIFLGFYNPFVMISVYLSFALTAVVGLWIKRRVNTKRVVIGAVSSSILFFFVTNLAVWKWSGLYEPTLAGLLMCFVMALPFLKNQLIGDLIFTGSLFGSYEFYKAKSTKAIRVKEKDYVEAI